MFWRVFVYGMKKPIHTKMLLVASILFAGGLLASALSFGADGPAPFRVEHYGLKFQIDPAVKFIKGAVTIDFGIGAANFGGV